MKITIKNKKSDKESAYKSGINLPNIEGVDWNVVNPGALTGPKKSDTKFNTMSVPMMGTNFQTTIEAGKEKEFDNLTPIEAMYMENVSKTLNEGTTDDEGGSDYKYEWTFDYDEENGEFFISNYEQGQTISVGDEVKVIVSDNVKEKMGVAEDEYELTAISYDFPLVGTKFGSLDDANDLNVSANTPLLQGVMHIVGEALVINFAISVSNGEIKVGIFGIQEPGATITISATQQGVYSCVVSGTENFYIMSTLDLVKFDISEETKQEIESQGLTLDESLLNVDIHPIVAEQDIEFYPTQQASATIPQGSLYYALNSVAVSSEFALNIYTYLPEDELIAGQAVANL